MLPETGVTLVTVAVVPATVKSAASTLVTFSLKVTRKTSESALVGLVAGVWSAIERIVGGVVSAVPMTPIMLADDSPILLAVTFGRSISTSLPAELGRYT